MTFRSGKNERHQPFIALGPGAAQFLVALLVSLTAVSRRRDLQYLAERLDPKMRQDRLPHQNKHYHQE